MMFRAILIATLLGITLAVPVAEQQPLIATSKARSWLYPLSKFFGDSSSTISPTTEHAAIIDDEPLTSTNIVVEGSSPSVGSEASGNMTRHSLVRLFLETDRQMRYWRSMAIMSVLSWFEHFTSYIGSFSESMKDADKKEENDPSLMTASLEGARQIAQMMSGRVLNRLGQMAG